MNDQSIMEITDRLVIYSSLRGDEMGDNWRNVRRRFHVRASVNNIRWGVIEWLQSL